MHKKLFGLVVVPILLWAGKASALNKIEMTESVLESSVPEILVPSGHGVVLNLENGRYLQSLWIDDPAILGAATNRPLCPVGQASDDCGFATAIRFLRLSGVLDLPGSSFSQGDGRGTIVNLETTNQAGEDAKMYQFLIVTGPHVTSNVSMVSVIPTPTPSTRLARLTAGTRPPRLDYNLEHVRLGHDAAISQGIADVASADWNALETFLTLIEGGSDVSTAMRESGVSPVLLTELERMGSTNTEPLAVPVNEA